MPIVNLVPKTPAERRADAREQVQSTLRTRQFSPFVMAALNRGTATRELRKHWEAEAVKYRRALDYLTSTPTDVPTKATNTPATTHDLGRALGEEGTP